MSTRAMIDVVNRDTGAVTYLYAGHDAYPSGVGRELFLFCRAFQDMKDMDSFSMKLLKMGAGIEMNPFGLEAWADYVYTIEFSQARPVNLICQHVNSRGDNKRPTRERLDPPIDLEAAIFS